MEDEFRHHMLTSLPFFGHRHFGPWRGGTGSRVTSVPAFLKVLTPHMAPTYLLFNLLETNLRIAMSEYEELVSSQ